VIILSSVSDEDAKKAFPGGWQTPKPYMRIVPQPADSDQEQAAKATSAKS